MLYSSSKSRLLKALGEAAFTDSIHATSPSDLTPTAYRKHLDALAAPPPLTERERALREVKQAEYEASKEDAFRGTGGGVRGGSGPMSAVMGVGAGLTWGEGVEDALKELAAEVQAGGSTGDKRKLVGLHIDSKVNTQLNLAVSKSVALDEIKDTLPAEGPQYTLYSYAPLAESKPVVLFIYSCPPKSPIRSRMIYSSSITSLIGKFKERVGVEVDKKVRVLLAAQPHIVVVSVVVLTLLPSVRSTSWRRPNLPPSHAPRSSPSCPPSFPPGRPLDRPALPLSQCLNQVSLDPSDRPIRPPSTRQPTPPHRTRPQPQEHLRPSRKGSPSRGARRGGLERERERAEWQLRGARSRTLVRRRWEEWGESVFCRSYGYAPSVCS